MGMTTAVQEDGAVGSGSRTGRRFGELVERRRFNVLRVLGVADEGRRHLSAAIATVKVQLCFFGEPRFDQTPKEI